MNSTLELFATELFLDIFEYLTSVDILYAFTNLNSRLNAIIHLYTFQIDFQFISPLKFRFICRHLPCERIHSLIFSETYMFNQIEQFQNYFPNFQEQFTHLKILKFIKTKHFINEIPQSVTSLRFDPFSKRAPEIHPIIIQQMKVLEYLRVSYIAAIPQSNVQFPELTHLIIDNFGSIYNLERILPYTENSITNLKIFFKQKKNIDEFFLNFQQLYQYLSHVKRLSIKFVADYSMTFDLLTKFLLNFSLLKNLTVEADGSKDLIDGTLWENFLLKIQLRTFNFRFRSRFHYRWSEDRAKEIMESFRSSFWLIGKQWYMACRFISDIYNGDIEIYSIPHFCPTTAPFSNSDEPIFSTAPLVIEKKMFSSSPNCFSLYKSDILTKPTNYYYTDIKQLELDFNLYHPIPSVDKLKNVMNLNHIQRLDISIKNSSVQVELQTIVNHMPSLNYLSISRLDFPLDLPPNIHFLDLSHSTESNLHPIDLNNIDKFRHGFKHVQQLHVTVRSEETIFAIIDRFSYSKLIVFKGWDDDILRYISAQRLKQNSQRLKTAHFTWKIDYTKTKRTKYGDTYQSSWHIYLFINDIN